MTKSLLKEGMIDPNQRDIEGCTPLHIAALFGNIDTVKCLLSDVRVTVNVTNNAGDTPLMCAALQKQNHPSLVPLLLSHGEKFP